METERSLSSWVGETSSEAVWQTSFEQTASSPKLPKEKQLHSHSHEGPSPLPAVRPSQEAQRGGRHVVKELADLATPTPQVAVRAGEES